VRCHVVVFSGGIAFVSFYDFTIGEVMYCICVIGDIDFASISMILELFRQCDIVFVFHLISITNTCVMKDIGGRGLNFVAFCPEANKDPIKLVNIQNYYQNV